MTADSLEALAAARWKGDGRDDAFDQVFDILDRYHQRVPRLIAALAATAPPGALPYIGTSVVEDLAFQVDECGLSGAVALQLVLDSGLSPSQLFLVLSGANTINLDSLDRLRSVPLSPAQTSWLLDDRAANRWSNSGQTMIDGDGLKFVPGQTAWQAELARKYPPQS